MKRAMLVIVCVGCAVAAQAGPIKLRHAAAKSQSDLEQAIATNPVARVTDAELQAEYLAANNQTKKDAVLLKMFQRNTAVAAVASERTKKDKELQRSNKK